MVSSSVSVFSSLWLRTRVLDIGGHASGDPSVHAALGGVPKHEKRRTILKNVYLGPSNLVKFFECLN